jgi:hypothetical protein
MLELLLTVLMAVLRVKVSMVLAGRRRKVRGSPNRDISPLLDGGTFSRQTSLLCCSPCSRAATTT